MLDRDAFARTFTLPDLARRAAGRSAPAGPARAPRVARAHRRPAAVPPTCSAWRPEDEVADPYRPPGGDVPIARPSRSTSSSTSSLPPVPLTPVPLDPEQSPRAHRHRRRPRRLRPEAPPARHPRRLGHEVVDHRHRLHRVRRLPADLRRRRPGRGRGRADRGIVLGGSGQGEQIAANKVRGVRAALCNDLYTARMSREHNDANVLSMGGRIVGHRPGRRDRRAVAGHAPSRAAATSAASTRSPTIEDGRATRTGILGRWVGPRSTTTSCSA